MGSFFINFHRLTPEQQRALVKRAPENKIEQIPAPLPENKTQDSKDISWKEGADNNSEVQTKKPVELPEFSNDGVSASFKGENYKRVPGSNKFVSPSGKYFLVD